MMLLNELEQVVFNAPLKIYEWSREKQDYVLIYDENETIFESTAFTITKEQIEEHATQFYKFMQENGDRAIWEVVPEMDENCKLSLGVYLDI